MTKEAKKAITEPKANIPETQEASIESLQVELQEKNEIIEEMREIIANYSAEKKTGKVQIKRNKKTFTVTLNQFRVFGVIMTAEELKESTETIDHLIAINSPILKESTDGN